MHGDQVGPQQAELGQLVDLAGRAGVGALGQVQAIGAAAVRRLQVGGHPEGVGAWRLGHAQRKAVLEVRLPGVVMHHGGDAAEQVLPGAFKQGLAAGQGAAHGDDPGVVGLDVGGPVVGVGVERPAEAAVVVAMQMIVGVDQSRGDLGGGEVEHQVEAAHGLHDAAGLDGDAAVRSVDQEAHLSPPSRRRDRGRRAGPGAGRGGRCGRRSRRRTAPPARSAPRAFR